MQRSPLTVSLYVPDVAAAVDFYRDVLGFEQTAAWREGDQPIWSEVAREVPVGRARIWFFSGELPGRPAPAFTGLIYLFVEDVDAEAKRLEGKVTFRWGPEDQVYGLRELGIEDPHGYLICFAKDLSGF
ncbi:MAG: VOC family protein [Kiloniellaceae bacterium]